MRNKRAVRQRAQSTLETAVLIVCVVAALVSMQIYMKRGVSGRLRQISDEIGPQYEPKQTTGTINNTISRDLTSIISKGKTAQVDFVDATGTKGKIEGYFSKREELSHESSKMWGGEDVDKF